MKRIAVLLLSFFALHSSSFGQGALSPPGPPAPTFKTLDQVEPRAPITNVPYVITQPGSYYLTTNFSGPSAFITISNSNVTVDFNGFSLIGGTGNGVFVFGTQSNLWLRNGAILNWSGAGVDASNARNSQFDHLLLRGNANAGLRLGSGCRASSCSAHANGVGIVAGSFCALTDCTAESNTSTGISTGVSCTILNCNANESTSGAGIGAGSDNLIKNCVANSNNGAGIVAGTGCVIENCVATSSALGDGISANNRCNTSRCTTRNNKGNGITAVASCRISGCVAAENTEGIHVATDCLVEDNECADNGPVTGGIGIRATGVRNLIQGNQVSGNGKGIVVDPGASAVIAKNAFGGNTSNFVFSGSAYFGTTNVLTGASITNHPWANFPF